MDNVKIHNINLQMPILFHTRGFRRTTGTNYMSREIEGDQRTLGFHVRIRSTGVVHCADKA